MKRTILKLISAAVLGTALWTSCTPEENNDNKQIVPEFPESVSQNVEPAGEAVISFKANLDWTASLPTDQSDFRIVDGANEVLTVRGKAGDATVTVKCLVKEQDFKDHIVELTLKMGGKEEVIASIILPSKERRLDVTSADVKDGAFVPATGENPGLDWSYTGPVVEDGGDIAMIWLNGEKQYKAYIRVDANFNLKFSKEPESGVRYEKGKVSGTFTEYSFSLAKPNTGEEAKKIDFTLAAADGSDISRTFNLVIPPFVPEFAVYPVVVEDGFFTPAEDATSGFLNQYEDKPVADNGELELIWPEDRVNFVYYILVESNFEYSLSGPEWLTVTEGNTNGARKEFTLNVEDFSLEDLKDKLVFTMKDTEEDKKIEFSYNVVLPGCKDIVRTTIPSVLEANSAGWLKDANGGYSMDSKIGEVSSAGRLAIYKFENDGTRYVSSEAEWLGYEDEYEEGSSVFSYYAATVKIDKNTGAAREGLLIGVPEHKKPSDPISLLNEEGTDVAEEYAGYLVVKVSQLAYGGPIEAVDPDYWPDSKAEFIQLTEETADENAKSDYNDLASHFLECDNYYRLTLGWPVDEVHYPTVGEYSYLKFNRKYTGYRIYEWLKFNNPVESEDFWVKVVDSQYSEDEKTIQMTPSKVPAGEEAVAYIVFFDAEGDFAAVLCRYDPNHDFTGGGETGDTGGLAFSYPEQAAAEGSTFVKLEPGDPLYKEYDQGIGCPIYHLTYTIANPTMSMLKGWPTDGRPMSDEWLTVEPGNPDTFINMDASAIGEAKTVTGSILWYDSTWATAFILVCTLDLTGGSAE